MKWFFQKAGNGFTAAILGDSPFSLRPILDRDHELQSRPHVGDRADFHIHQTGIKSAVANRIFRQVGGDS